MKLDEKWIRAHLPEDCRDEPIDWFSGFYLDGLTIMSEGERGEPDTIRYEAKDEDDLKWWQLDFICRFVGKADKSKTWRWYRDHAENGRCATGSSPANYTGKLTTGKDRMTAVIADEYRIEISLEQIYIADKTVYMTGSVYNPYHKGGDHKGYVCLVRIR